MRKALLLTVAFLSGAILMGLELVGSRVLAPHFGGSIFVWGSLIGVFLGALSMGYYIGGRLADKHPRATLLALLLLASALFVLILPWAGPKVCDAIAARYFGPRLNPLIACMVLFFVPGLLMGATSPFVVRLTAIAIEQVGKTAGAVFAVSTLGSIAGTIITSFFLISYLYTSSTIYLFGILLLVTSLFALLSHLQRITVVEPEREPPAKSKIKKKRASRTPVTVLLGTVLLASCLSLQPARAATRTLLECDSPYQRLFVTESEKYRWLQTSSVMHSRMSLSDPNAGGFEYTDYVDIAFLLNPQIKRVLIIGLGGGTIPKRLVAEYPEVHVDVVEIDPKVIEIADKYFYVKEGPRLDIHEFDGRIFLRRSKAKYDLIMMDAYYEDTVPFFLTTKEFFQIVHDKLNPNGVFMNNVIGVISGPKSKFFRSIYKTTDKVFPVVYVFKVPDTGLYINIEIFAVKSKGKLSLQSLEQRLKDDSSPVADKDEVEPLLGNYLQTKVETDDVPTLLDDYAPVDALIHLW